MMREALRNRLEFSIYDLHCVAVVCAGCQFFRKLLQGSSSFNRLPQPHKLQESPIALLTAKKCNPEIFYTYQTIVHPISDSL